MKVKTTPRVDDKMIKKSRLKMEIDQWSNKAIDDSRSKAMISEQSSIVSEDSQLRLFKGM